MRSLSLFATLALIVATALQVSAQVPNNNPRFSRGNDVTVVEDSGAYSAAWATTVSDGEGAGGANAGIQSTSFEVVAADTSLFSIQPTITAPGGILTFTPAPDAFGTTLVSVTLRDSGTATCIVSTTITNQIPNCPGGCSPLDCSASVTVTFTIIISPVNDCPTFAIRGDQLVLEDSGQSTVTGFANQISRGAANENTQTLVFALTAADTSLFAVQPQVAWNIANPTGADLTFTPATNAHGSTTVTITATDNGGTANSGCAQSTTQTFTITVQSVNDAPFFNMGPSPIVVQEDSGANNEAGWASGMSPGPANEAGQTVQFNLQYLDSTVASLFSVQPRINAGTGDLSFTVAPDANTFARTVQMYVQLQDNAGTGTATDFSCFPITSCPILTIQITPVNDVPFYTPGGDIRVFEDLLNYAVPPVPPIYSDGNAWATAISVGNAREGLGANNEGQEPVFYLTNNNQGLFDVQPAIDGRGTLTFQLAKDQSGVAVVTVRISDTGTPQVFGLQTTFQITVEEVNDQPSFIIAHPNPLVINEDNGAMDIAIWATNVIAGPVLTENAQINRFILEPTDTTFFSVQPTLSLTTSGTARLQFRTTDNVWGTTTVRVTLQDDGGVLRHGVDSVSSTLTIIVNSVNDPPTFQVADPIITVSESVAPVAYARSGFAYNISAGGNIEGDNLPSVNTAQQVRFTCTLNNHHLFSSLPSIDSAGILTFTPAANQFGDAIVTAIAQDDNMPPANSVGAVFTIRILPVNNAPTFTHGGDITGREIIMCQTTGSCARTFSAFIKAISSGPDVNEASQTVTFAAAIPPAFTNIFTVPPSINSISGDLSFTLAMNRFTDVGNPVPITITATDNGGTTNGGDDTTIVAINLEVQKQDSPPQFNAGGDISVVEDSTLKTAQGWATGVQIGPLDTSTAGLSFRLKVADPTLFSQQPAITLDAGNTGTLTFIPQVNRYGATLVQITLDNSLNSQSSQQFTITLTISPVNDVPVFNGVGNIVVYESSGNYVGKWVNSVTPGPYEAAQIISWTVSCDAVANTLFATNPAINGLGEMGWTLNAAASGLTSCLATAQDNGGILDGGVDSANQRFNIDVKAINNAPSFVAGADIAINEGVGAHSSLSWASNMNAGAGDSGQVLTFVATTTNDAMFAVPVRIDSTTGSLTFTLAAGMNGNVFIDVHLMDNGATAPSDNNKSPSHRLLLVVTPVNSAPAFTLGSNIAVLESSGLYTQKIFSTGISAGPLNEAHQSLRFTLTPANANMFALPPTIDPATGDLQFSTRANANGVTSIAVCLQDNGGTALSGVDQTCSSMSISIVAVNTAPDAVVPTTVTILEDSGAFAMSNFLTGVTAGGSGEGSQQINSIAITLPIAYQAYFTVQPTISLSNYELTFTPTTDFFGEVTCTVTILDNGGVNNGGLNTKTATFKIVALPVNDKPSFIKGPDVAVFEDAGAFQSLWAGNIIAGPTNEAAQTVVFSCLNNKPLAFTKQPSIDTSGYLTFTTAPNANGFVTVNVYLKDNGGLTNGGVDTSDAGTSFTITITSVNDKPYFVPGPAVTINEDSKSYFYGGWATGVNSGPNDEQLSQHNLNFTVYPQDKSFFSVQPTVQYPSGDLSFGLNDNKYGVTTFTVTLTDNLAPAAATYSRVVTLTINGVNDAPSFTTTGDVSVKEDSGDNTVKNFIKSSNAGAGESTQTVSYTVTPSNGLMFASPIRIVGSDLLFTPADDANGLVTFVVNATDRSGGNHWYAQTYKMNILPVNDPPEFDVGSDVSVSESSGTTKITNWLKSKVVVPGPSDESAQLVTAFWSVTPAGILSADPLLDLNTNTLTVAVTPHRFGTVTVSLYYKDNGGTTNGGDPTSDAQTFTIAVTPINNAPTFIPGVPVLYVGKTVTAYSAQWATNISAGIYEDGTQTSGFDVTTTNSLLFATRPAVSPSGVMSFVLSVNAQGNTTLAITLKDSQGAGSQTTYVTLIVASYTGPDLIVLTMSTPFDQFNQASFRSTVASALGIQEDQVVIHSARAGSTIVTFQLVGKSNGATNEQLINNFLSLCNSDTEFRAKLNVVQVTVQANSKTSYTPSPNAAAPTTEAADDFNYVALGIGLFAVLAFCVLAIILIMSYKQRQDDKKKPAKYVPTSSYGEPPTQGNMQQRNPVNDFDRRSAAPYDESAGSPQLQRGRSQRWGGGGEPAGNAPVV